MRVLSVASEIYPLVKTGGLADQQAHRPDNARLRIGADQLPLVVGDRLKLPAQAIGVRGTEVVEIHSARASLGDSR